VSESKGVTVVLVHHINKKSQTLTGQPKAAWLSGAGPIISVPKHILYVGQLEQGGRPDPKWRLVSAPALQHNMPLALCFQAFTGRYCEM
jgi:hypothetical protein